jgi:cytochrome d ubiquinol oxidase subunit I
VRLQTGDAVSAAVSPGMVLTTLIGFTLLYGALMVVEVFLLRRYIQAGPDAVLLPGETGERTRPTEGEDDVLAFAY